MEHTIRVLFIDTATGFYRLERFPLGAFFGPVDLGLHLAAKYNSLNIGAGMFAGSIIPGSNRLVITGFSPCWGSFYISSMGGAALVFDNLGINMISLIGRAPQPSILYCNRNGGEEIQVTIEPVDIHSIWREGRGGIYSLIDYTLHRFGECYATDPRVLAVGPASLATDFGAIGSSPVRGGTATPVDTWAGRGGFGSRLLQQHGIAAIIYGGTFIDEDFRDRNVADRWFEDRYQMKTSAKDMEATTKYRFDPKFDTGGTFGVNFASMGARILAFNYRSIYMSESERSEIHERLVRDHYLKQFNEETIKKKQQATCGEPCAAVCKKMNGEFKKDYEPYQAMGPLCGIFDQRAAERLTHHADAFGFDAIAIGGVLSWLMECLDDGLCEPNELGVTQKPVFSASGFSVETDSMHNAALGVELLDSIIERRGKLDLSEGARAFARRLSRDKNDRGILDRFIYCANARRGWMVPNQYWTPGVLSPMPIMGKYYMHYGSEFLPPRILGRTNAKRFQMELIMDNAGLCRFHRGWAEEMLPDIMGALFGKKDEFINNIIMTASRIASRNVAVFWEPSRNIDYVHTFLKRAHETGNSDAELSAWLEKFNQGTKEAALEFWYEIHKGIHESLREF